MPVGSVYAAADSLAWQVLDDMQRVTQPRTPAWVTPVGARNWSQVRLVHLPIPRPIQCLHPYDIRLGHWERFAEPRMIPVLAHGQMTCTVIAARHLRIEEVQRRISLETRINDRYWQLIAVTRDVWIIVAHYLPTHIVDQLDELHELRQNALRRGGMHGILRAALHVHRREEINEKTDYYSDDTYVNECDWVPEKKECVCTAM